MLLFFWLGGLCAGTLGNRTRPRRSRGAGLDKTECNSTNHETYVDFVVVILNLSGEVVGGVPGAGGRSQLTGSVPGAATVGHLGMG